MKIRSFTLMALAIFLSACGQKSLQPSEVHLIPQPLGMELKQESFQITAATQLVVTNKEQEKAANYLQGLLKKAAGFQLAEATEASNNVIRFEEKAELEKEAYELTVNSNSIVITASSGEGWFYGVQTLRQLLPPQIESKTAIDSPWMVPAVTIADKPRFGWRGMEMDFSRHFFTIDEVKEFMDYMALYKLNTYHMHLTDDQGWRIEIKEYPLLTEKGAWRIESSHDRECIEKAKENETFKIAEKNYHQIDGQRMYGGFFTQEQIKEIVAYAADRYITVIPEIDMPGHFKAAIDNYPYLACKGEAGWGETFSIPACLGKEETYEFIENILSEVAELFPSPYIHIGGDEVNISEWKQCPKCQKTISTHKLKDEHELQAHFNRNLESFLHTKGKRLLGWDEIVEGGLTEDATMMWWRNWAPEARYKAADNGNDMIICPDFEYYFDFTNEATPLEKVYNYEPVPEDFTAAQEKHVLGVQANLWSELIPNFQRLQLQTFPRMLALAETAWQPKGQKNFDGFLEKVQQHYKRMDVMGIHYYIPPINGMNKTYAFVDSIQVALDIDLKDAKIYYTLDGTQPTEKSIPYTGAFWAKESAKMLARAYNGRIWGDVYEAKIDRQQWRSAEEVTPNTAGFQRWAVKNQFKVVEELKAPAKATFKTVATADMGEYKGQEHISMVFNGYFKADTQGIYEFSTTSDDGSLLYIGDTLVVDNGGNHAAQKRAGMIALNPGYHKLTLVFHQGSGGGELSATFAAPEQGHLPLESAVFFE